jgi:hypothetical protein
VARRATWEAEWPRLLLPPRNARVAAGFGADGGGCEPWLRLCCVEDVGGLMGDEAWTPRTVEVSAAKTMQ